MIIAIEGCIASGKTTMAKLVGSHLGVDVLLEDADSHPFLADFYLDPGRFALETELAFALIRYHQMHMISSECTVVSDFSSTKGLIFARMNLSGSDLALYEMVYPHLLGGLQKPDLVVFLDPPLDELMRRIRERGRPYELDTPISYLRRLRWQYENQMNDLGRRVEVVSICASTTREGVLEQVLGVAKKANVPYEADA